MQKNNFFLDSATVYTYPIIMQRGTKYGVRSISSTRRIDNSAITSEGAGSNIDAADTQIPYMRGTEAVGDTTFYFIDSTNELHAPTIIANDVQTTNLELTNSLTVSALYGSTPTFPISSAVDGAISLSARSSTEPDISQVIIDYDAVTIGVPLNLSGGITDSTAAATFNLTDGANPNLVTANKTLVGAINEVAGYSDPTADAFTYHVSQHSTSTEVPDGTIQAPFISIQAALDAIGSPADLEDERKRIVVNVNTGMYDEDVVVPAGRSIVLNARGYVLIGDGAGQQFTSTVPRSLYIVSDSNAGFATGPTPSVAITASSSGAAVTDVSSCGAIGWRVSGDVVFADALGSAGTAMETRFSDAVIEGGIVTSTSQPLVGSANAALYNCQINGSISGPSGLALSVIDKSVITGAITGVASTGIIRNTHIGGNVSVDTLNFISGTAPGIYASYIGGVFSTGDINTLFVDSESESLNEIAVSSTLTKTMEVSASVVNAHSTDLTSAESPYAIGIYESLLVADTAGGAVELQLPDCAVVPHRPITIEHATGSNAVTIYTASGDTIDETDYSATPFTLALYQSCTIYSDGVNNWRGIYIPVWNEVAPLNKITPAVSGRDLDLGAGGITTTGNVTVGALTPTELRLPRVSQPTIPGLPIGDVGIWRDTSRSQTKLIYNDVDGGTKVFLNTIDYQNVLTVSKGGDAEFSVIQNAVDACTAGVKTVILVYPGVYNENVTLKDQVSLIGTDNGSCIIATTDGACVTAQNTDMVTIQNMRLISAPVGGTTTAMCLHTQETAQKSLVHNCVFVMSPTDTYMVGLTFTNSNIVVSASQIFIEQTGTQGGESNIFKTVGHTKLTVSNCSIQGTIDTIMQSDDAWNVVNDMSRYGQNVFENVNLNINHTRSTDNYRFTIYESTAYGGRCVFQKWSVLYEAHGGRFCAFRSDSSNRNQKTVSCYNKFDIFGFDTYKYMLAFSTDSIVGYFDSFNLDMSISSLPQFTEGPGSTNYIYQTNGGALHANDSAYISDIESLTGEDLTIGTTDAGTAVTLDSATGNVSTNKLVALTNNTNATSPTTGALVVSGGAGFGEDINVSGSLTVGGGISKTASGDLPITSANGIAMQIDSGNSGAQSFTFLNGTASTVTEIGEDGNIVTSGNITVNNSLVDAADSEQKLTFDTDSLNAIVPSGKEFRVSVDGNDLITAGVSNLLFSPNSGGVARTTFLEVQQDASSGVYASNIIGQSFDITHTGVIKAIRLDGYLEFTFTVKLYHGYSPNGTLFYTSPTLSCVNYNIDIILPNNPNSPDVVAGEHYYMMMEPVSPSYNVYIAFQNGNLYTGGKLITGTTSHDDLDIKFRIYVEAVSGDPGTVNIMGSTKFTGLLQDNYGTETQLGDASNTVISNSIGAPGNIVGAINTLSSSLENSNISGFYYWNSYSGTSEYCTISGTSVTLNRSGFGQLSGRKINWDGGQTIHLDHNKINYVGIDVGGTFGVYETFIDYTSDIIGLWVIYIDLGNEHIVFCDYSGPESVDTKHARQNTIGSVITGNLGNIYTILPNKIGIYADDTTSICNGNLCATIDANDTGIVFNQLYRNTHGNIQHSSTDAELSIYHASGGTLTAMTPNYYAVDVIYAGKHDGLQYSFTKHAQYFCLIASEEYPTIEEVTEQMLHTMDEKLPIQLQMALLGYVFKTTTDGVNPVIVQVIPYKSNIDKINDRLNIAHHIDLFPASLTGYLAGSDTVGDTVEKLDTLGTVPFNITDTTTATSTTTGALTVAGGFSTQENAWVGGNLEITSGTVGGPPTRALGVSGDARVDGDMYVTGGVTTGSASTKYQDGLITHTGTGDFTLSTVGSATIVVNSAQTGSKKFYIKRGDGTDLISVDEATGDANFTGIINGTVQSSNITSTNDINIRFNSDGVGTDKVNFINNATLVASIDSTGSFNADGNIVTTSSTNSTDKTTGALVVAGGVGIGGDVHTNDVYTTNVVTGTTTLNESGITNSTTGIGVSSAGDLSIVIDSANTGSGGFLVNGTANLLEADIATNAVYVPGFRVGSKITAPGTNRIDMTESTISGNSDSGTTGTLMLAAETSMSFGTNGNQAAVIDSDLGITLQGALNLLNRGSASLRTGVSILPFNTNTIELIGLNTIYDATNHVFDNIPNEKYSVSLQCVGSDAADTTEYESFAIKQSRGSSSSNPLHTNFIIDVDGNTGLPGTNACVTVGGKCTDIPGYTNNSSYNDRSIQLMHGNSAVGLGLMSHGSGDVIIAARNVKYTSSGIKSASTDNAQSIKMVADGSIEFARSITGNAGASLIEGLVLRPDGKVQFRKISSSRYTGGGRRFATISTTRNNEIYYQKGLSTTSSSSGKNPVYINSTTGQPFEYTSAKKFKRIVDPSPIINSGFINNLNLVRFDDIMTDPVENTLGLIADEIFALSGAAAECVSFKYFTNQIDPESPEFTDVDDEGNVTPHGPILDKALTDGVYTWKEVQGIDHVRLTYFLIDYAQNLNSRIGELEAIIAGPDIWGASNLNELQDDSVTDINLKPGEYKITGTLSSVGKRVRCDRLATFNGELTIDSTSASMFKFEKIRFADTVSITGTNRVMFVGCEFAGALQTQDDVKLIVSESVFDSTSSLSLLGNTKYSIKTSFGSVSSITVSGTAEGSYTIL